jgi:hypothetical protein
MIRFTKEAYSPVSTEMERILSLFIGAWAPFRGRWPRRSMKMNSTGSGDKNKEMPGSSEANGR